MTRLPRPTFEAPAAEWLVYGDALQEANDPRGKLVGLSIGVEEGRVDANVRAAYVHEHCTALLGFPNTSLGAYELTWRFSELAAAAVRIRPDDQGATLVRTLLDSPAAELLHDVTLIGVPDESRTVNLTDAMAEVGKAQRITSLGLVDERARNARMLVSRDFEPGENLVTLGPLKPFWARLQHVQFDIADSEEVDLENIDAPELRSFALRNLRFCDWEDANTMTQRLGGASWPKLESFELRLVETLVANVPIEIEPYVAIYSAPDHEGRDDGDEGDGELIPWGEQLLPVLATLKGCPLRRLALTSFGSSAQVLEALEASGLLPNKIE
ncbi:MAG: hypothetical protein H0V17_29595, partial [Deltaproteobacteria bacterium]|nr:hypothetical protein [Deltaproteobacteria bacterium]